MANAMMGEMTPEMATAVSSSPARKILLPITQEKITIVGVSREPLPHLVNQAVAMVGQMVEERNQQRKSECTGPRKIINEGSDCKKQTPRDRT
jgi:hypothetical protein